MMRTCLVTGGAGFIGCAISSTLVRHFDRVVALDNMHPQIHATPDRPARLDPKVELVVGDVTLSETWNSLLQTVKPDVVIHLAAETGTGQSLTEGTRHAMVNVVGTTQMLDAFVRFESVPRRIVLTSSRAVYGEGAWQDAAGTITYPGQRSKVQLEQGVWDFPGLKCLPFEATRTQPRPTSIYGATKLTQEMVLSAWALSFGVEVGLLRLQNVYGPGQSLSNPYTGIVSLFARLARGGKSIPLYEDGEIVRDFVFIDDVSEAVTGIATAKKAGSGGDLRRGIRREDDNSSIGNANQRDLQRARA
nr:NAD-dependent epimerase/dehydratase family protein [Paraburkholderia sp. BL8N3]